MANEIKCPNCGHSFTLNEVMSDELNNQLKTERERLNTEASKWKKEQEEKFQQQKIKLETEIQEQLRKSISSDYENKIRMMEENNKNNEEKLKEARKKELDFLQKEQQLKNKEAELEIILQKKLQEERAIISEQIRTQENEKNNLKETGYQLKVKELEVQLAEQKKLADEMTRRAEQSSMQRQGEVQELLLEEILKENFPFDLIEEVGKGIEGADCIQVIRNSSGKECGKIIYESKRTKNWSNSWIDKLKADMRNSGADVAVLVTQVFPKDMDKFGEKDGVWLCNFNEVSSVAYLLRYGIFEKYEAQKSQENKGGKMQMLYDYLISNEFRGQMEAMVEGLTSMKQSIDKEKMQMEKIWKEREKQLQKVIINTIGMYGSVKGIAGASIGDIPLLDGSSDEIQ